MENKNFFYADDIAMTAKTSASPKKEVNLHAFERAGWVPQFALDHMPNYRGGRLVDVIDVLVLLSLRRGDDVIHLDGGWKQSGRAAEAKAKGLVVYESAMPAERLEL